MPQMKTCSEILLDDLLTITAIPLGDVSIGTAVWQITPTIPKDEFSPTLDNAVDIGRHQGEANTFVTMSRNSGKAKDDTGDSVAGRLHTVSVKCKVDDRDGSVRDTLLMLERTPHHLLLTFLGEQQAFVQATKDNYACTVERYGAETSVAFKVYNIMGVQLLV